MSSRFFTAAALCLLSIVISAQQKGYYRTPAIYQNTIVFTAEGDLWKYDLNNGITSRLTSHPGVESNPAISPDGKQVSFIGEYEGVPELYVMSINGSIPKRLTFDGGDMNNSGWTSDGKILYSTGKYSQLPSPQMVKLDPSTLNYETIPLWEASNGCYDENGNLFFTRLPNQGSKTKRYKGGFIEQVWKFDGKQEAVCITAENDGTSASPMIYKDHVYFASDRDGTMNIWSMTKDGKQLKQHTFSSGWDIQSPAIDGSKIVYQKGADICLYDIESGKEKILDINLLSDFDQRKPRWIKSPVQSISDAVISPNGNYAAIISRGRLFVSPAKGDRWVEVTRKSGIRFKEVHFMNDKSLAVLSDESGEFEIWKMNADGSDAPKQLTKGSKTLITSFTVSPDEKYIAYNDKNQVMRIAEAPTGALKFELKDSLNGIAEMKWSPDSKFLAFSRSIDNLNIQVSILNISTVKYLPITTPRLNSYNATWSSDSNWLYFVSDRNLRTKIQSPWGSRQPEPFYTETGNIYALQLDTAAKFPFLQKDSWLTDSVFNPAVKPAEKKTDNKKGKEKKEPVKEKIYDWSAISKRLFQVPVKSGNIGGLVAADGYLYWLDRGAPRNEEGPKLMALKIEENKKPEPVEVAANVDDFSLSGNKKKIIVGLKNNTIAIADANGQKIDFGKNRLELDNWNFVINPVEDWKEMFADAWRMTRDYFYDRDLHKVNWVEVRKQYEPLLERITDRYELDDLLSQMVAELSALHTFVGGGEKRRSPDQIQSGFLGALLTKNDKGVKIEHIYKSDPDYPDASSPLSKPELSIQDGDIITAVNNIPLKSVQDISELLANKTGIPVKLSLLNKEMKPFEQVVKPISSFSDYILRYGEWEFTRREKVDSISNNDIGYVHLKAMGSNDMDDFVKQFYPVFNRKGLIIDVRHNFGGNIDSWILEKLMRKAWMYWQGRSGQPYWNMQYAFRGHMVILCDQVTSSDGEAITEGFRRLGMGKVIGMRTWGGEIWLTGSNRLVDNGVATAAEFGVYGTEGQWLIEGRGVEPDFKVDNLPFETYKGKDAQLDFAIDYLKKKIKEEPVDVTPPPVHPDKSFKYKKD
ncbi:MAG: S41 family peptidase [Bacteroidota bacterium]